MRSSASSATRRASRVVEADLVGDPIGVDHILAREHESVGRPHWRAAAISGTRNRTPPMLLAATPPITEADPSGPVCTGGLCSDAQSGRGVLVRSEQVLGVNIEELDPAGRGAGEGEGDGEGRPSRVRTVRALRARTSYWRSCTGMRAPRACCPAKVVSPPDVCPDTGPVRLSYGQARALLDADTASAGMLGNGLGPAVSATTSCDALLRLVPQRCLARCRSRKRGRALRQHTLT
nr:hypothetical protein [Streptomyces scabiei]